MSNNLSLGVLQITAADVVQINDALRQIQMRIDQLRGLNGRAVIFDRVGISTPVEDTDAAQLGGLNPMMTTNTAQTVSAIKTFTAAIRYEDSNGTLLHAFATKV